MDDAEAIEFQETVNAAGIPMQIFGLSLDNARAFWNWQFMEVPELPQTRELLMRACDLRLPLGLSRKELDFIGRTIISAADGVKRQFHPFATTAAT